MRSLATASFAFLLLAGCKDHHGSGTSGSAPSATASPATSAADLRAHEPTGIADCDAYFKAAQACFPKADTDLRKRLREAVAGYDNQLEHAASDVAKQAVGVGCAAALDALKEEPACR